MAKFRKNYFPGTSETGNNQYFMTSGSGGAPDSTHFNINFWPVYTLIALCTRANQVRQDKLIIFFLISSRVNFTGQSIPVEENLQCGLERGLSWGDTLLHCHACYKYNAATILQMLQFYNTGRHRLYCTDGYQRLSYNQIISYNQKHNLL